MAARLARMAASMAASAARTALVGSSRAPSSGASVLLKLPMLCTSPHRALRTSLPSSLGSSLRCFSAAASAAASRVAEVVDEELAYEKEEYKKPEIPSLPEGWSLSETPGNTKVSLTREYGNEVIQVDFTARQDADDDDYDDEEEEGPEEEAPEEGADDIIPMDEVNIEVSVMKENSDTALIFEVETNGDYLRILDVSLERMGSLAGGDGEANEVEDEEEEQEDEEDQYFGPVFNQLDDSLQQAFLDYLTERGVTLELGQFIMQYADDKEQREYMHWLQGVQTFLKA